MKASLSLLLRNLSHSASLLWAMMKPLNGMAGSASVPLKLPSWVAVRIGLRTLSGALNISTNSTPRAEPRHSAPE